jgi:biotin carboxyl carrier protein
VATVRLPPYIFPRAARIIEGGSVPDIEAHITGTVWKIECAVGDRIDEGDTVVILESM